MNVRVKWSLARAKAKLRRWERRVDKETLEDLKLYGETAARAMIKCTPPSHKGTTPTKALKALKARIRKDFEGDSFYSYDDDDIIWFRDRRFGGQLHARFVDRKGGRPSPFRVIAGRVNEKALRSMNVGRYRVEFIKQSLGGWIKRHPEQYYMGPTRRSYRFKWRGVRHVTTIGAVQTEIRRRQYLAGRLMAGWNPFAKKVKVRLPAAAGRHSGAGTATTKRDSKHKAVLTATNKGHYPGLQDIVNRQMPGIRKKNRNIAKRRAAALGKKLKKA